MVNPKVRSRIIMNPTARRTKYEIWAEILEVCSKTPRSQSWILRKLRLKTTNTKDALNFLTEHGLIERVQIENSKWDGFRTTVLGKQALHDFYKLLRQYFQ